MKKMRIKFIYIVSFIFVSCTNTDNGIINDNEVYFNDTSLPSIIEEIKPNLSIKQGYVSQKEEIIKIVRGDEAIAIVKLSEPKVIAQAEEAYGWGYFQFPKIFRAENGYLLVKWQMKQDSQSAYGIDSFGRMISKDEGKTWEALDRDCFDREQYYIQFENGDILQIKDPTTKNVKDYSEFPTPVNNEPIANNDFYKESDLPEELKGAYLEHWSNNTNQTTHIHAKLDDPGLLRYAINDEMPVVWWGDIRKDKDGSLLAGVYPTFYLNSLGEVLNYGVSFYKSEDKGYNWKMIGKIPYQREGINYESLLFDGSLGYQEPTFEIVRDGYYVCVIRTGNNTPMLKAFSSDNGKNWTTPQPFTPNGVKPSLFKLDDGVLCLASGRPGVQLRFSLDGYGNVWTEPIDMLPFNLKDDGTYDLTIRTWETCGYPSILKVDEHTFYMVYSDFKTYNKDNQERKSIMFRKVEVITKQVK